MDDWSLIVGLGNPGEQYARTRHNAGFLVLDELADRFGANWSVENRFSALVARADFGGRRLLLAKPQTYMNLSGEAVGALMQFYRVPVAALLVVVDDANLASGAIRLRPGGSSGGHHGLDSITQHLGGENQYARQRIGIGRADARQREITDHVLGRFGAAEWPLMQKVFVRDGDQIECWLKSGIEIAMNQYNGAVERPADKKDSL
jgi:peptidyl-tRNA hydrolase, PTH1 family